jgi:hypothetical protein
MVQDLRRVAAPSNSITLSQEECPALHIYANKIMLHFGYIICLQLCCFFTALGGRAGEVSYRCKFVTVFCV